MSPISNASRLADFGTGIGTAGAIIQTDNVNQRVGIGTTNPQAMLQVGTAISMFGSTGIVSATSFSGSGANLTGLPAGTTITVADESSDTTCFPSFFTAATGDLAPKTGTNLTFNSSSGALTATSFVGALTGNVTGNASGTAGGLTGTPNISCGTIAGSTGTFSGVVNVDDTTDSTSSTSGALIVDGGLGVAKNVYIGAGLSVAGTLTYEDVTSVDSVGLITAKSGVNITGGELTVGSGITMGIAGVATFSGTGDVHLHDNVKLNAGDGSDLQVYHDGSNSFITNSTGILLQRADDIRLQNAGGSEVMLDATADGSVDLYYNNSKKFETTNDGTVTTGIATATAGVDITGGSGILGLRLGTGSTIFSPGSNLLALGTNDKERLRVQSDGSINIETALGVSNEPLVEIYNKDGSVMTGQCLKLRSNRGQGVIDTAIFAIHDDGDDEIFRVDNAGQVGIGTTVCGSELHVMQSKSGGSSHGSSQITLERSGTNYLQFLTANDGTSGILFGDVADNDGAKIAYDHNVDQMQFNTGTVQRLHITSTGGFNFRNGELIERCNITAGKLSDNTNIDLEDGMVQYFTTEETTTCTPNIRVSSSKSLNDVMSDGDAVTVTVITTADATGYSANWTIDGNAVTEEWVGGSAPSAGGSDGLDIYVLTIICIHSSNTGDSGFKVIANVTNAT